MANTYFQFKQFTVHQEHTAMKVCTDACLFGAWLAEDIDILSANDILDIGTGTGLLSLMIAQAKFSIPEKTTAEKTTIKTGITKTKSSTKIIAVEIELEAAKEASSNVEASPWKENITIENTSIQAFRSLPAAINSKSKSNIENELQYDCIISNPPFFEGDLQSPNANINLASHSTALPWLDLLMHVDRLLKENGFFYVLIPALRAYTMQKLAAEKGIVLVEEVVVFNAAKQKPFRVLQKFQKTREPIQQIKRSNFIIKDTENNYTESFVNLLKPYYLHL
jgi:tRNA1Val (adenine37-N6)-methyltransferase